MTRNRSLLVIGFLWACCAAHVAPAAAQYFKVVKGTLTQVAAGRNEVFGVVASNRVYRYNAVVWLPAVDLGKLLAEDDGAQVGIAGFAGRVNEHSLRLQGAGGATEEENVGRTGESGFLGFSLWLPPGGVDAALTFGHLAISEDFRLRPDSLNVDRSFIGSAARQLRTTQEACPG